MHPVLVARRVVVLADTLDDGVDAAEVLHRLVDAAVEVLGVAAAGVMVRGADGRLQVAASSSEESRLLELYQVQADEGPCVDAVVDGEAVHADDLREAVDRWPRFAPAAVSLGLTATSALPIARRGEVLGSLNVFGARSPGLSGPERDVAQALADATALGLLQQRSRLQASQVATQLQTALDSRVVLEQAKGVLAARADVDLDHAFRGLRSYARARNLRLADVARSVVAGQLAPAAVLAAARR